MRDIGKYVNCRPSSANRWVACPGSALFAALPDTSSSSKYAARGTTAHAILEECLTKGIEPQLRLGWTHSVDGFDIVVNQEDVDAVKDALDDIIGLVGGWGDLEVEQEIEVDIKGLTITGRLDAVIIDDDKLTVVDYKHGKGVVSAIDNYQLFVYLLGAIEKYGPRNRYEVIIIQPRAAYGDRRSSQELTNEQVNGRLAVVHYAIENVLDCATAVLDGNDVPKDSWMIGKHCHWCPGVGVCPGYAQKYLLSAMLNQSTVKSNKLIESIIANKKAISTVIKETEAHAHDRMVKGDKIKGLKLVGKYSNKTWRDDLTANDMDVLNALGLTETRLVTIKDAKGTGVDISEYVKDRARTGYAVVTESDKREALVPIEEMFDDES